MDIPLEDLYLSSDDNIAEMKQKYILILITKIRVSRSLSKISGFNGSNTITK